MRTFAIFGTVNDKGIFAPRPGTDATVQVDGRLGRARRQAWAQAYCFWHRRVWPEWAGMQVQFHMAPSIRELPTHEDRISTHPTHTLTPN